MIGALFALGGALSWGTSQIITKFGAAHTTVTRFVLIRSLVGLSCILAYGFLTGGFTLPEMSLVGWAVELPFDRYGPVPYTVPCYHVTGKAMAAAKRFACLMRD